MNNDRIAAIRERCDEATPGRWIWDGDDMVTEAHPNGCHTPVISVFDEEGGASFSLEIDDADRDFIANSITDIPYLLTEIDRLNAELAASQRREQAVSETIKEAMHIIDKKSCVDYYDNSICMLCKHDNPFMPVDRACEACKRADHFELISPQEGGE